VFDPRQVLSVFSLRPWTSCNKVGPRGNRYVPGVSGDTLVADMGQCDEHSPPDRVLAAFLRSASVMFRSRPELSSLKFRLPIYRFPRWLTSRRRKRKRPWTAPLPLSRIPSQGAPIGFAPDPRTGHSVGMPGISRSRSSTLASNALNGMEQNLKPVD